MTDIEILKDQRNEVTQFAKVFDLKDALKRKRQMNPQCFDSFTMEEVFEEIEKAGYRPATLAELLAFARDCWRPGIDPSDLTEGESAQRVHIRYLYALVPFVGPLAIPQISFIHLGESDSKTALKSVDFLNDDLIWMSENDFLVIAK